MKQNTLHILEELLFRYPMLETCKDEINESFQILLECFQAGGKLLIAGNGGSDADSEHISGELMKSFRFKHGVDEEFRSNMEKLYGDEGSNLCMHLESGVPVIPLPSLRSISSAFSNDVDPTNIFAQLTYVIGCPEDVFLGITTSGNSKNIVSAFKVAKARGLKTICLTGMSGGVCKKISDICICVPESETFKIQELHLPIYHALCSMIESELFWM